ncbi:MAG: OB-fold nucleic acid binding domain-containing protein [Muribaculaceae bacterium]|nr:OB-fold nucleic acid binding domain-containing protein [Muribaculaceae bacterium]
MKLTKSYVASLLLMAGAFTACEEDIACPPYYVPTTMLKANTTIADLKAEYWDDATNYIKQIGTKEDGEHVIIAGRVISSDRTGNIYKSIYIQDATGALTFSVDNGDLDSLAQRYKVGGEVVIDLTDAYIGKYAGLQQVGSPGEYNGTPQASFMELEAFEEHAHVNGFPNLALIDTFTTTIPEINAIRSNNAEKLRQWQSQLIRIDNVAFENGGVAPFAESPTVASSTNQTLLDADGNRIIVRNSGYATFHSRTLPAGTGSVVGVLGYYNGTWQILLRDYTDCIGFSGDGGSSSVPVAEANTTIADLKAEYWDDATNYYKTVGTAADGGDIVIKGRVISSDKTGNIFKALYIQDETGALSISIDSYDLYKTYPLGQEILINMTGAGIGKYAGLQQMGAESEYNGTPQTGRMALSAFKSRVTVVGTDDASKVTAVTTTIDVINAATSAEALRQWQNRLVRFENVRFVEAGQPYAGSSNTNRTLTDSSGNKIIVRNSSYATFKGEVLPSGNGTVTGVLGYFNGTWQLLLRDTDDCQF